MGDLLPFMWKTIGGDGVSCECLDLMVRHLFEPRRLLLECDECGYKDIVFIHAEVKA